MVKKSNRRKFINKSLVTLSGASLLSSCLTNEDKNETQNININFNKKFNWKMVTTWAPNMPVLGEGCNLFADWVQKMSGGRLNIKFYGVCELFPSL